MFANPHAFVKRCTVISYSNCTISNRIMFLIEPLRLNIFVSTEMGHTRISCILLSPVQQRASMRDAEFAMSDE